MIDGNDGTSEELTVDDAALRIAGLLSDDEDEDQEASEQPGEEPEDPEEEPEEDPEDPEEEPEGEEGDEAGKEQPQVFTVKHNGVEEQVPLDELLKGYSRTADYTRKTQEVAEQRKQVEAMIPAVNAAREQYLGRLQTLDEIIVATSGAQEPDWETVRTESPDEFPARYAEWQLTQQRLGKLRAEKEKVEREVQHEHARQMQHHLQQERARLVEAIPELGDAEQGPKVQEQLLTYARSLGYTPEDLDQVYDHRLLVILRKAALYDTAQKQAATTKPTIAAKIARAKENAPVAKPGVTAPARAKVSDVARQKQRLAQTGNVRDAARLIEMML